MNYRLDSVAWLFWAILTFPGIMIFIRNRHMFKSFKQSIVYTCGGLILSVVALVGSCLIYDRWSLSYILAFLSLRKINGDIVASSLRYMTPFGYVLISWGLVAFVLALMADSKKESNGDK